MQNREPVALWIWALKLKPEQAVTGMSQYKGEKDTMMGIQAFAVSRGLLLLK